MIKNRMKNKGVTLIESMLVVGIISLAMLGGFQYQVKKAEKEKIDEFVYDYSVILKAFESKINFDGLEDKEHWKDLKFDHKNYKDHVRHNLIRNNERCADDLGHASMDKSYINCFFKTNFKQFNVLFKGSVDFYKDESFKSYKMTFRPKNKKGLEKIKILERSLKLATRETDFYSDIVFYNKGQEVSYIECIKEKEHCLLQFSFGMDYNYLDEEVEKVKKENVTYNKYGGNNFNDLDDSYDYDYKDEDNNDDELSLEELHKGNYSFDSIDDIKEIMEKKGFEIDDKEARKIREEVNKLKNNPEFIEQLEKQMELNCSHYDEDDYYFMELYEQENVCYIYKTQGVQ